MFRKTPGFQQTKNPGRTSFEIIVKRNGRMEFLAWGKLIECDQEWLREWVESEFVRPFPPRIELTLEQAESLVEYLKE